MTVTYLIAHYFHSGVLPTEVLRQSEINNLDTGLKTFFGRQHKILRLNLAVYNILTVQVS